MYSKVDCTAIIRQFHAVWNNICTMIITGVQVVLMETSDLLVPEPLQVEGG